MRNLALILIIIIASPTHGQLLQSIFSSASNAVLSAVNVFQEFPIISLPYRMTWGAINTGRNAITSVSGIIIRILGGHLPSLIGNNIVHNVDNIVADYQAGLGNEDATLSIEQIIVKYGHEVERHMVVTEDQYGLTLFRIPSNGPAVFLMHGLLGSADDYVIAGAESGLAFILAREGYDVWMGNARGSKHSKYHVILNPAEATFWDFSWHEIGYYDLPAMIDYVLVSRNTSSLKYIGFSQGTTTFFVMASQRPDYNKKIDVMIALSPVAFMTNVRSPIIRLITPGTPLIHFVSKVLGIGELLPDNSIIRSLKMLMCGAVPLAEILCSNILFLFAGFGFEQLNVTNLPVVYGHVPAGSSVKQVTHYSQGIKSGDFKMFDYGYFNMEMYGSEDPPHYPLHKIVTPVYLTYANADWLSHPIDVEILYNRLGNVKEMYEVPFDPFTHLDYVWGKDVKELIYEKVKKILLEYR